MQEIAAEDPDVLYILLAAVDDAGHALLQRCVDRLGMNARGHSRILKAARTVADLYAGDNITIAHLSETINYRILDRESL